MTGTAGPRRDVSSSLQEPAGVSDDDDEDSASESSSNELSSDGETGSQGTASLDPSWTLRLRWKKGDSVEVFSFSKQRWMGAVVHRVFMEGGRKWVEARFENGTLKKDVAVEDAEAIRPCRRTTIENDLRKNWGQGSELMVYSNSKKAWFCGIVKKVFTDEEGEWLQVQYGRYSKEVHRSVFCF